MSTAGPRLYNTLAREREVLAPADPPAVQVYACGPTVYDHPHVGNFRYFVWVDVVHRFLRWRGFDVHLVMNFTDVDDKIIARAQEAGVSITALADEFIGVFRAGLERMRILPARSYPRATEHIAEMVTLIEALLDRGHAYVVDGNVFFRVESFGDYGRLAGLSADEMQSTERVEGDAFGKEDPRDFALWKATQPGEPAWPAPFGLGRPGWHLECSAMSMAAFGESFDMHLGGADLMFPHHENEIAQSEAATGAPFVRHWMHCQHLIVDGAKMSKSEGNFLTLADLEGKGCDPVAIRYLLLSVHYRRQLNLTNEALEQATASVQRLRDTARRLEASMEVDGAAVTDEATARLSSSLANAQRAFAEALDDDLNTSGALGHLFVFVRELNAILDGAAAPAPAALAAARDWFNSIDEVLAVFEAPEMTVRRTHGPTELVACGPPVASDLAELVLDRMAARSDRDFAAADALRDRLSAAGIEVEDAGGSARWKLVSGSRG